MVNFRPQLPLEKFLCALLVRSYFMVISHFGQEFSDDDRRVFGGIEVRTVSLDQEQQLNDLRMVPVFQLHHMCDNGQNLAEK
ncbi:hypothetical protein TNCV_2286621 [Trichonephila clavipes]|nr:hypothetical protein TNCV_2286621 [Trichonephila clavipes]